MTCLNDRERPRRQEFASRGQGHVHRLRSGRGWVQAVRHEMVTASATDILALRCLEASGRWEEILIEPGETPAA